MQKHLLYESFVHTPPDVEIFRQANEVPISIMNKKTEIGLKNLGYTEEQLERLKKNIEIATSEAI